MYETKGQPLLPRSKFIGFWLASSIDLEHDRRFDRPNNSMQRTALRAAADAERYAAAGGHRRSGTQVPSRR